MDDTKLNYMMASEIKDDTIKRLRLVLETQKEAIEKLNQALEISRDNQELSSKAGALTEKNRWLKQIARLREQPQTESALQILYDLQALVQAEMQTNLAEEAPHLIPEQDKNQDPQ